MTNVFLMEIVNIVATVEMEKPFDLEEVLSKLPNVDRAHHWDARPVRTALAVFKNCRHEASQDCTGAGRHQDGCHGGRSPRALFGARGSSGNLIAGGHKLSACSCSGERLIVYSFTPRPDSR